MLGDKLKELRIQRGLRQNDILEKFSLSSSRYSQYETGKRLPDYELLIKFANFYGVSVDYLLDNEKNNLINKTNDSEMKSLIGKLCSADDETRASVEQFLNYLLYEKQKQREKNDKKKIAK